MAMDQQCVDLKVPWLPNAANTMSSLVSRWAEPQDASTQAAQTLPEMSAGASTYNLGWTVGAGAWLSTPQRRGQMDWTLVASFGVSKVTSLQKDLAIQALA